MMTKKSTRSTATFANVYTMLDRDELRANGMSVKDDAALIERLKVNTQQKIDAILLERVEQRERLIDRQLERVQALRAAALKRATSGGRRRYYEAS